MKTSRWRDWAQWFWAFAGSVSIRTKIFGIVLGSTLLLSVAFTLQFRAVQIRLLEQKAREQGVSVARDVAARATDLILINDLYALHQLLLETQSNYQDIRYIFVIDPQGEVLAHTFGDEFPIELLDANWAAGDDFQNTRVLQTNEGMVWDVAVPIFDGRAGVARVGVSDTSLRQTITNLTTQLSVTIVAVLTASLLAATFLTWLLTRPILALVSATEAVSKGDFSQRVPRWADDEIGDLAEAFNQMTAELARADELQREREQLRRQLLEGVIAAQEDERRRIARELHDSTSQSLTSLMVSLRNIEAVCEKPQLLEQVTNMRQVLSQTLDEVHNLAVQLRPAALDDLGLEAALGRFVQEWQRQHRIQADLTVHIGENRLPEIIETAIYRIVQEALTNVARHAQATSASVLVHHRQRDVVTVIEDDGIGFDPGTVSANGHLGLLGIRERAELLQGRMTIESAPGKGTSVFVSIPLLTPEENGEIT